MEASFQTVLKKMYGEDFEFTKPYKGAKGVFPVEIFYAHEVPDLLLGKIDRLGFKIIHDSEMEKTTDYDIIESNCGYRCGTLQIIFAKTKAFEVFEKAIRQDYEEYIQKEKVKASSSPFHQMMADLEEKNSSFTPLADKYDIYQGSIYAGVLWEKFPELKGVITGSKGYSRERDFLAESKEDLEKAKRIIKSALQDKTKKDYQGAIRIEDKNGLDVLVIAYDAVEDLKTHFGIYLNN